MSEIVVAPAVTPTLATTTNIFNKFVLVLLLVLAMLYPDQGNLRDKAAGMRAVGYPVVSFTVPFLCWTLWRDRAPFPWVPDLLITVTCFTDILGNRMDLYDTVVWFDDWMHFVNTGLLAAAIILLTLPRSSGLMLRVERGLAFGATSAIAWELAAYFAFISRTSDHRFAYADTLSDLALGTAGAAVAAITASSPPTRRVHRAGGRPAARACRAMSEPFVSRGSARFGFARP